MLTSGLPQRLVWTSSGTYSPVLPFFSGDTLWPAQEPRRMTEFSALLDGVVVGN